MAFTSAYRMNDTCGDRISVADGRHLWVAKQLQWLHLGTITDELIRPQRRRIIFLFTQTAPVASVEQTSAVLCARMDYRVIETVLVVSLG